MKNKKGFTLVEVMIVIAILAILAALVIPNFMRSRMVANDTNARAVLKNLSTAAETYSGLIGSYPADITSLTGVTPPYLNADPCGITADGFTINCTFSTTDYVFSAVPGTIGVSGTTTFTMTSGGVLAP